MKHANNDPLRELSDGEEIKVSPLDRVSGQRVSTRQRSLQNSERALNQQKMEQARLQNQTTYMVEEQHQRFTRQKTAIAQRCHTALNAEHGLTHIPVNDRFIGQDDDLDQQVEQNWNSSQQANALDQRDLVKSKRVQTQSGDLVNPKEWKSNGIVLKSSRRPVKAKILNVVSPSLQSEGHAFLQTSQIPLVNTETTNQCQPQSMHESEVLTSNRVSRRFHFSKESTALLKKWLLEHIESPYLKYADKVSLSRETGLSQKQVQNWFTNVRKRILGPLLSKYKGKHNMKKIVLKLKLKLDSSDSESIQDDSEEEDYSEGVQNEKTELNGKRKVQDRDFDEERHINKGANNIAGDIKKLLIPNILNRQKVLYLG